ncbi:ABC transporter ATP-binding protein [Propioniciclava sinopodophylli]|uniref:ABC transporter ATP-binding protein n=1 Tax=Propioniciclava sinopodophylli TaxID=1837344 RepID=UPI0019D656C0|nr:ABC transporter ATP-binding protein [Propioniciclava sinopodophylli]
MSLVGALMEAGFLVLVTGTILALAGGQDALTPVLGFSLPVGVALAIGFVALFLRLAVATVGVWLSAELAARVTGDQRDRLARSFLNASWSVQQAEPSGRLQELMSSFVWKATQTAQLVGQMITAGLSLVAFLGTGLVIDPLLTAGVLVVLAVLGSVLTPLRRLVRRISQRAATSGVQYATSVSELGALGQEMHVFGARDSFLHQLEERSSRTIDDGRKVQVTQGLLTPVYTFLAYAAVLAGMAALWALGVQDLASVGAVMLLMLRSLAYAQQLLTVSGQLAANEPFLENLDRMVRDYRSAAASDGSRVPAHVTPLTFTRVTFGYGDDRVALTELTGEIGRGELIGVVGPSGAGKSTLAQLALGLRDPLAGRITVAGEDLRSVNRDWWTDRVAFVAQEPRLFTGTVAENIRFFRSGISDEDLRVAARQANVLADIEALPRGFDTHLGERGGQLSGGQRQRLSIARALVGRPELLIMDEPTSALDGRSESLIRDTMAELHGSVTMLVIAHRLTTLDLCDRIMVVEGGRLTAFDTPDQLVRSNRYYRKALESAGMTTAIGEE